MRLERVFQWSLYVLFSLASLMLVIGEAVPFPQGLSFPLCAFSLFFVDRWQTFRIPQLVVNLLAVVAIGVTWGEFVGEDPQSQLLSGTHLLVYLGWLVMLVPKNPRQYWWLLTLAVLQVAVAAVLVEAPWEGLFSLMLIGFMVLATWTLSVFSLHQVQGRLAAGGGQVPAPSGPVFRRPSIVSTGWQLDPHERWISLRFVMGVCGTAAGALIVSSLFFLLIPRFWLLPQSVFNDKNSDALRPLTGFTERVQLGEIGRILESTETVMEIELVDVHSGDAVNLEEHARSWGDAEPVFRGSVLAIYRSGGWRPSPTGNRFDRMDRRPSSRDGVRQDVRLEPIGTQVLFGLHPVEACRVEALDQDALYHPATAMLIRPQGRRHTKVLRYSIFSPPTTLANRLRRVPALLSGRQRRDYLQLPRQGVERLVALARRVAGTTVGADAEKGAEKRAEQGSKKGVGAGGDGEAKLRALRIQSFLRDGDFGYSLDASVSDTSLDPVEDFLFVRRSGHCEYFASAMTLMLRGVGIPARLISGFKGGTRNQLSGTYIVQQRHAHVWVEAWVEKRWVRFDPTPAGRGDAVRRLEPRSSFWRDFSQVVSQSWRRYVVELSLSQQQQLFYTPMKEGVRGSVALIRSVLGEASAAVQGLLSGRGAGEGWPALLAVALSLVLLAVAGWGAVRWIRRWQRRGMAASAARDTRRLVVEFYERFRRVVAGQGLVRIAAQTPREFAESLGGQLEELLSGLELSGFPERLTEAYYAVRFGGRGLDQVPVSDLEDDLDRFDRGLQETPSQQARR